MTLVMFGERSILERRLPIPRAVAAKVELSAFRIRVSTRSARFGVELGIAAAASKNAAASSMAPMILGALPLPA